MDRFATQSLGRRRFLHRTGQAVGSAALLPLLGSGWEARTPPHTSSSTTPSSDPDQLFVAGRFAAADRAYERILRRNPGDAHALAQRGYIALLSNRFEDTEHFLTRAIALAPDDNRSKARLADCFVRQDDFARAVPLLRDSSSQPRAEQLASVTGEPFATHGPMTTQLPFKIIDPLPAVDAIVNGTPATFFVDTGATLGLTTEMAEASGIRPVATTEGQTADGIVTMYLGIVDSLQLGRIEVRNVPVTWFDGRRPSLPDGSTPGGAIGTTILYHFLSTMDYARGALVLRQKTRGQLRAFQANARSVDAVTMPFWMAPDHFLHAPGSLNDYGPRVVTLDTGGSGIGVAVTEEIATQLGFELDYANPREVFGQTVYPFTADEVSLGTAVRRGIPGIAGPLNFSLENFGFETLATISHEFLRPFAITFDFVNMTLYITGTSPDPNARATP